MPLQVLKPKHREIMRRLVQGQTQSEIAREFGIDPSNMSTLVNAPLFQQELKELEASVEGKAVRILNKIYDYGERSLDFHKQIVDNVVVGKDGVEVDVDLRVRQRSATALALFVSKALPREGGGGEGRNGNGNGKDGVDIPYERRLREVITREVYMSEKSPPSLSHPEGDHANPSTEYDYLVEAEEVEGMESLLSGVEGV